jgi:hypothetical protein
MISAARALRQTPNRASELLYLNLNDALTLVIYKRWQRDFQNDAVALVDHHLTFDRH